MLSAGSGWCHWGCGNSAQPFLELWCIFPQRGYFLKLFRSLSGFHHAVSAVDEGRQLRKLHEFPPHSSRILYWLAPEVLRQNVNGYNAKSDVYSLGIAACELANGEIPFENMATTQVGRHRRHG